MRRCRPPRRPSTFSPRPDLILGLLALTLTDHLATAHRRLAAVNPAAHEPDLAMSLNNLSNRLAEARRNAEAEQAIQDPDELRTRSD